MAAVAGSSTPLAGGAPPEPCGSYAPPMPVGTGSGSIAGAQYVSYARPTSYAPGPMPTGHTLPTQPSLMSSRTSIPGGAPPQPNGAVRRPPLTEGIPDPASIETQKKNHEKVLDAQLEQSRKWAAEHVKQQKEALKVAAEQQLAMYKAQMDQSIKQHEMELDQHLQHTQMELQRANMQQKNMLEQQASALAMEYKQKQMQDEMMAKQAEMDAQMKNLHFKAQEEMQQHYQEHMKLQQQHQMQHQATQQQVMQHAMYAPHQMMAPGGPPPYPGMPPAVMHMAPTVTTTYGAHPTMPMEHYGAAGMRTAEGPCMTPAGIVDHRGCGAGTPAAPGYGSYGGAQLPPGMVYAQPLTSAGAAALAGEHSGPPTGAVAEPIAQLQHW